MKRTSLLLLLSLWFLLASGAFGITSKPSVTTYIDSAGHQRIYSFARGNSGHLAVNYWDGFSWQWADQGLPAGSSAVDSPAAITYVSGGNQRIYVFATANNGHLVVNYWDGSAWHWADQGLPAGASAVFLPAAITYVTGTQQRIYVFATASNGHLVVNYWDGSAWHWADQGLPASSTGVYGASAITYLSGGRQRIYVFVPANNGHLAVNYWDGSAWHWADQGLPAGASAVFTPAAITYVTGGEQRIYVFAEAGVLDGGVGEIAGHLVVNYWDGFAWHWADQGVGDTSAVSYPTAITYANGAQQLIYVFAQGSNYHLVVNYWDGSAWHWADQGLPAGVFVMGSPSAITYVNSSGVHLIYVFGEANNNHLVVNYWTGSAWYWADQGSM